GQRLLAPKDMRVASDLTLLTVRSAPSAACKSIGTELFLNRCAILAMFSSFLALTVLIHSSGGFGQSLPMPSSSRETHDSISPTIGTTISTLLSISLGSMSI